MATDQELVRATACAIVDKLNAGEVTPLDLLDVLEQRIAEVAERRLEDLERRGQPVQCPRADPPPVALVPDDPEIAELQAPFPADEDVHRREVAVKHLAAVQLSEHLEDARDFAPGRGFRPPLPGPAQERPEVAFARVLALSRRRAHLAGNRIVPAGDSHHGSFRSTAIPRRL